MDFLARNALERTRKGNTGGSPFLWARNKTALRRKFKIILGETSRNDWNQPFVMHTNTKQKIGCQAFLRPFGAEGGFRQNALAARATPPEHFARSSLSRLKSFNLDALKGLPSNFCSKKPFSAARPLFQN